jgi:hypothetical protein
LSSQITHFFLRGWIFTFFKPEKYDLDIEKIFLYWKGPLIYKIKKYNCKNFTTCSSK